MILVTVGMQLGFDRLIKAMDKLAPSLDMRVIAQTGKGAYSPRNMEARDRIEPAEFEGLVNECEAIVSHAGIGTVLTAQRFSKPIILFPRRFALGEHRNDHQIATAKALDGRPGILLAMGASELETKIKQALVEDFRSAEPSPTSRGIHKAIEQFIQTGEL